MSIQAQSDTQLNVTMFSSAVYMRISNVKEDGKQRLMVPYAMSTIKDTRTHDFVLAILGNDINAPDSTTPEAIFSVRAPGMEDRNVTVRVDLQPYPSCRHTNVGTEDITATVVHDQTGIRIRMIARDTDGFIVTKTLCEFTIELVYEGVLPASNVTLAVVRNSSNPSEYHADILPQNIRREGVYRLIVLMHQAWNDVDDRNIGPATCEPRHWTKRAANVLPGGLLFRIPGRRQSDMHTNCAIFDPGRGHRGWHRACLLCRAVDLLYPQKPRQEPAFCMTC